MAEEIEVEWIPRNVLAEVILGPNQSSYALRRFYADVQQRVKVGRRTLWCFHVDDAVVLLRKVGRSLDDVRRVMDASAQAKMGRVVKKARAVKDKEDDGEPIAITLPSSVVLVIEPPKMESLCPHGRSPLFSGGGCFLCLCDRYAPYIERPGV